MPPLEVEGDTRDRPVMDGAVRCSKGFSLGCVTLEQTAFSFVIQLISDDDWKFSYHNLLESRVVNLQFLLACIDTTGNCGILTITRLPLNCSDYVRSFDFLERQMLVKRKSLILQFAA